jgi:hypothetical protein
MSCHPESSEGSAFVRSVERVIDSRSLTKTTLGVTKIKDHALDDKNKQTAFGMTKKGSHSGDKKRDRVWMTKKRTTLG